MSQTEHKSKRPGNILFKRNTGSGTLQNTFWTVSRKILFPSVAVMAVVVLGLIIYLVTFTAQRNQSEAMKDLTRTKTAVESHISELQTLALGLATETANNPSIQAAFARQDRKLLTEITLPTFQVLSKDFAVKQYQFILPPATSFLRVHQLEKYGDDLSSIRFTVLEANKTQKPVSGIEIGRGGLGVRGEVPVFYQGKHIGVVDVGLDIGPAFLEEMKKQYGVDVQIMLEKEAAQSATFTGATSDVGGPTPDLLLQASTFSKPFFGDVATYDRVLKGETLVSNLNFNHRTYSRISFPLKDYSGKIIGILEVSSDRTDIIASQSRSLILSILISLAATVLGSLILVQLINYTVRPIKALTEVATVLASGNLEHQAFVQSNDEVGILAKTFNMMISQLRETLASLEKRVAERTHSLELASEVGRSVSQMRSLDIMLKDATEIIRSKFNLYYVQVYLTNPAQNALVLQSGTGSVGAELAARGHRLPMATSSINGRAAVEKHAVVISDTTSSATFLPNPLLPETRSEMTIPLMVSEKVVGVLDLQSQEVGSLNQEILPAFEALAGQLAVAIENANLLAETEQARAEVEAQAQRLTRANWTEYLDAIHKPEEAGFVFEQNKIIPLTQEVDLKEKALVQPITITGEPLGNLVIDMEGESPIVRTDELLSTVARQVAQQIENLRLLDSAERYRLEAEEASRRLTRDTWKTYVANTDENLSFIYDLKEVRANNDTEDQQAETIGYTLPLKIHDEAIGKLVVQGLETTDDESVNLANAIAERLSAHIESLRLYDQAELALTQSEKLFDASRRLTQAAGLQELMSATVTSMGISEVNRALLTTFDYDEQGDITQLTIIGNWWNGSGHEVTPVGTRYPLEIIRAMTMFVSPVPVFFSDTLNDERVDSTTMQLVKRLNLRAVAVLPLHLGARQIGALILEAEEPHSFTQDEIRLFSSLAPQIATIVQNQRQFAQAQKQAEREAMLNVISQKIQSATSVEAVLQIAARELGHALGAPMTIAQLSMKDRSS